MAVCVEDQQICQQERTPQAARRSQSLNESPAIDADFVRREDLPPRSLTDLAVHVKEHGHALVAESGAAPWRTTSDASTERPSTGLFSPSDASEATQRPLFANSPTAEASSRLRQLLQERGGAAECQASFSAPSSPATGGRSRVGGPDADLRFAVEEAAAAVSRATVAAVAASPRLRIDVIDAETPPQQDAAAAAEALLAAQHKTPSPRPRKTSEGSGGLCLPTGALQFTKSPSMRERFNKQVSVTTGGEHGGHRGGQVFRILKDAETVADFYMLDERIYNGGQKGKVYTATRKTDGEEVIIKMRPKRPGGERSWRTIMDQVHQLRGSRHVLDILEILEDRLAFYVVMPKCNGGELFEFLVTETEVPEAECKRIIWEIAVAVGHLHDGGLVHRDVKPENILFDTDPACAKTPKTVKLIDFDTCVEWTPASPKSNRFVGTPGYIAPEALLGEITPQSDLWSIGVILYILMTGETPWTSIVSLEDGSVGSPSAKKMYDALKSEVLDWSQEPWPSFPLACDLCQRLIAFRTDERLATVQELLSHPWLAEVAVLDSSVS